MKDSPELWLPTSTMRVTVEDGKVRIVESMTMEKRKLKMPAGFQSVRPKLVE